MLTVLSARPQGTPLAGLDALALASTLSARICHDLAGSLGALTGTLELAAEEGDAEALKLSLALAQELAARLRLLRAAWGMGGHVPGFAILQPGFPGAERLRVAAEGLVAGDERVRRLALSLLLAATTAMPRGGLMRICGTDGGLALEIEGVRAAWPLELRQCVTSDSALLAACEAPRAMAVALACLQARAMGWHIVLDDDTHLRAA